MNGYWLIEDGKSGGYGHNLASLTQPVEGPYSSSWTSEFILVKNNCGLCPPAQVVQGSKHLMTAWTAGIITATNNSFKVHMWALRYFKIDFQIQQMHVLYHIVFFHSVYSKRLCPNCTPPAVP